MSQFIEVGDRKQTSKKDMDTLLATYFILDNIIIKAQRMFNVITNNLKQESIFI